MRFTGRATGRWGAVLAGMLATGAASAGAAELAGDDVSIAEVIRKGGRLVFTRSVEISPHEGPWAYGHTVIYQAGRQVHLTRPLERGEVAAGETSCWVGYSTSRQVPGEARSEPGLRLRVRAGYGLRILRDSLVSYHQSIPPSSAGGDDAMASFTIGLSGERKAESGRVFLDLDAPIRSVSCHLTGANPRSSFTVGDLRRATDGLLGVELGEAPRGKYVHERLGGARTLLDSGDVRGTAIRVSYDPLTLFRVTGYRKGRFFGRSEVDERALRGDDARLEELLVSAFKAQRRSAEEARAALNDLRARAHAIQSAMIEAILSPLGLRERFGDPGYSLEN